MQVTENDVRGQLPNVDIDRVATALNSVATALGLTEPLVTATGRRGERTLTVDDEVAQFVQNRVAAARPQAAEAHNFGFRR